MVERHFNWFVSGSLLSWMSSGSKNVSKWSCFLELVPWTTLIKNCCIFQPAFGCCTLQSLVEICFFNGFYAKKQKKGRKSKKIDAKKLSLHQNASRGLCFLYLFVSENIFLPMKRCLFLRIKPLTSILEQKFKKMFFSWI